MNTWKICIILLIVSLAFCLPAKAQISDPTFGYKAMATETIAVGTSSAVIVGTMPAETHALEITAIGGDINRGASSVPTGVNSPYIASGTTWLCEKIIGRNPTIYLRGRTASATAILTPR